MGTEQSVRDPAMDLPAGEVSPAAHPSKRWLVVHRESRIAGRHLPPVGDTPAWQRIGMQPLRFTDQFRSLFQAALDLAHSAGAEALLVLLDGPADWERLAAAAGSTKLLVAAENPHVLEGAAEAGLKAVPTGIARGAIFERLTQAVLEAVADDFLQPGSAVVALYAGFDADTIDSVSIINLDEHLNRLTGRDLRQLETRVPLDTLKLVVDLAIEIGREGREGKPIGTLFVVGDSRKVLACSHPAGFDPVRGYGRKERNLADPRVREGIKEVAQMDGAIIVSADGTVEAACRYLDCSAANVTLSKGLGARHWAAAAISRATNAVAVAVSETNGTVRIFQNGEVVLRVEPQMRRPMVWREFDHDLPGAGEAKPKGE